jgi:ferredoxin-thioredoxin reductase catalytic subunit
MKNKKGAIPLETKEEVLKRWKKFAKDNNLELNQDIDINLKAEVTAKYNGVCACLPRWRTSCPCPEVLDDIKEANACYCMVFKAKGKTIDLKEHSKMTKKIREKLGINKKKV